MEKQKELELLAPSGDWDSFLSAINNGANAVYLGLGEFNARAKSTYFTTENIARTVEYAHLRGVKVYVTINTLVRDDEMADFIKLVEACIDAKVDAYIVQDYGCAKVLREMYPNIVLHASTQMGIHNKLGAIVAKKAGFCRVVLSREAKLEDIIEIADTGIEVEFFVQGALCVAFSGNCYFSALRHNMSGNRGKCLQLCRLPYVASIENRVVGQGYLLSTRDLCMLKKLETLVNAGVISFKIEGRLRRAGYVAQTVKTYRKALDSLAFGQKFDTAGEIRNLKQVFSRGDFNYDAYLSAGVPDDVINPINQNHLGLKIGEVMSVERFKDLYKVGIRSSHELKNGDGLKFCDKIGFEKDSIGVGNVEKANGLYYIFTKHKLTPNLVVYLTLDSALENCAMANTRKIGVTIEFSAKVDEHITVRAITTYPTPAQVVLTSDYVCTLARTSPTTETEIREILGNLDLGLFDIRLKDINLDNVFIPKSALKELRRNLAEQLKKAILRQYEAKLPQITRDKVLAEISKQTKLNSEFSSIVIVNEGTQLDDTTIGSADLVILAPDLYTRENVQKCFLKLGQVTRNIGLALPTIANGIDCKILSEIVASLPHKTPILIQNAYGVELAKGHYIIAGTDMNVFNNYSIKALRDLGVDEFVWSKEIACENAGAYEYAYGHQVLMHFAHCPYKTLWQNSCDNCRYKRKLVLKDQAGKEYLIARHKISQCYFTLYSRDLTNKNKVNKKLIDLRIID